MEEALCGLSETLHSSAWDQELCGGVLVQYCTKTKALHHEHKWFAAHNNQLGNVPAMSPFYKELHRILREAASIRLKWVAKSPNLQRPNEKGMSGSEELFSHDLITNNQEDIHFSMLLDAEQEDECEVAELSAAQFLAHARNCKRCVSVLTDVTQQMCKQ
uniref:Uncharacterized protein n=1 Tax=Sphaerodactylus townsendi TaxID=933632 RepID=A0ACB8G467_9SAUR